MRHRIGTNQYCIKPKYHFWSSVWFIAFLATLSVFFLRPTIVSPCPDTGCFVQMVYATSTPTTIQEKLAIATIRQFGVEQIDPLFRLVMKESSFNPLSINPYSGACGLFQAYPCKKMPCSLVDVDCQITWGLTYIKLRYGNPQNAWNFWVRNGWY